MSMVVFIIQSVRMVEQVSKAVIQQRNNIRTGGKKKYMDCSRYNRFAFGLVTDNYFEQNIIHPRVFVVWPLSDLLKRRNK